jgi:peptide/nickel transport system substrate-binding protein
VLIIGCAPSPAPTAQQAGTPPQRSAPTRITASIRGEPATLNDVLNRATQATSVPGIAEMQKLIAIGLVVRDESGTLRPRLAEAVPSLENGLWAVLPDGRMEVTWRIRADATWHDGTPFTSEDLLFTARVIQDRELAVFRSTVYDQIDSVEAPGPETLVVRWKRPYIYADTLFSDVLAPPFPRHLLEGSHAAGDKEAFVQLPYWNEAFVGTGPFRVREFVRGSHFLLGAYDGYLLGRPRIDEIEVQFVRDQNTIIAYVLAGRVDMTIGRSLAVEQAVQARDQWREGTLLVTYGGSTLGSWIEIEPQHLNPTPGVVSQVQFRRAMLHGLDRQSMADTLQLGMVPVAHSFLSPRAPEYKDVEGSVVRYEYEPRRAAAMLEELGYGRGSDNLLRDRQGQPLSLEIRAEEINPLSVKSMLAAADFWSQLGLNVEPVVIPPQRISDREYFMNFPAFMVRRQPNRSETLWYLHSSQSPLPSNNWVGRNYSRYANPEYDALIDRYYVTIPEQERAQVLQSIMRHMSEQLNLMGLYYDMDTALIANRINNVSIEGQGWNAHEWEVR